MSHEVFLPLSKFGTGDATITIHDTSGGVSHANYIKVAGVNTGSEGTLILSGWVNDNSPYLGAMSSITSYTEVSTLSNTSGVQGVPILPITESEVSLPPGYAVSSCGVLMKDAGDIWTITYGKRLSVPPLAVNKEVPSGRTT